MAVSGPATWLLGLGLRTVRNPAYPLASPASAGPTPAQSTALYVVL